jgi:cell division protein FtsA
MAVPPIVALEIGTSKVVVLVGELREGGHVMITGMGRYASTGVRKGEIVGFDNAVMCVRSALQMAEDSAHVAIRQIHLVISGGHIQSMVNRGTTTVINRSGEITSEDVQQVMEIARAVNLPPEREILHTVCQHFCIDDQEKVIQPEGLEGSKIALDMLVVHGVRNRLRNTVKVVRSISMDVEDVAFSGLCAALAVLTPEQKKTGVAVIDLGGGATDFVAYAGQVLADAGSIGVGGDHVTNDIAVGLNVPSTQADKLKRESGSAIIEFASASQRISLPADVGFPGRSVSLRSLHTIMNARMEETLGMIKKRFQATGILHHLGAGIMLTGGGAHMNGICELTERVFGLPCSVGRPRNVSGLATATEGPEYAACVGMVQYGFRTRESQKRQGGLGSTIRKWFGFN